MHLCLFSVFAIISAAVSAPVSFSGSLPAGSGFPAPPSESNVPSTFPPHPGLFGGPAPSGSLSFPSPSGTFSFPSPSGTFSFAPPSGTPSVGPFGLPHSGAPPSGAPPSGAPPSMTIVPTQSA